MDFEKIKNIILSETFIQNAYYFNSINSTNEFLKSAPSEDNVLAIAGYQTYGKGRLNRKWESEPDKNLIFSIKKRFNLEFKNLFTINFYFSYFLLKSIEDFLKSDSHSYVLEKFSIKWPNDLLYDNKKFAGILMENNLSKKEFILGIGININQQKFHEDYNKSTTSLSIITGHNIIVESLLVQILKYFTENIDLLLSGKCSKIYELWKSKFKLIGKRVELLIPKKAIQIAQVIDINEDGSIKLMVNNSVSNFFSGEIKLLTN